MSDSNKPDDATTVAGAHALRETQQPYSLIVTAGPDTGAHFRVMPSDPARSLIGKSEVCDIRLNDGSVSRRHAAVQVVDGLLRLADLDSTNGTLVNGVRVYGAQLSGGETVKLGATSIRIERDQPVTADALADASAFGTTIGASQVMRRLYPLAKRLAQSNVPVIIEGETGTGKEQFAESMHRSGPRRDQPFVVFDCTAVAPTLVEAELFGHEKGSFTGADSKRVGVFEHAHGGTLLIDEIGELPLALQPKLLRAIERLQVIRVGGRVPISVDVRVFAATRRDLDRAVQLGRFRDDLYHRLAVARVELPPLRERHGDIALLAQHFYERLTGDPTPLPSEQLRCWEDYPWPGNVRELKNAVARRVALGDLAQSEPLAPPPSGALRALHERDPFAAVIALELPLGEARQRIVDAFERRYLEHVLAAQGGNVTRAAAAAGIDRRHFYRLRDKVSE